MLTALCLLMAALAITAALTALAAMAGHGRTLVAGAPGSCANLKKYAIPLFFAVVPLLCSCAKAPLVRHSEPQVASVDATVLVTHAPATHIQDAQDTLNTQDTKTPAGKEPLELEPETAALRPSVKDTLVAKIPVSASASAIININTPPGNNDSLQTPNPNSNSDPGPNSNPKASIAVYMAGPEPPALRGTYRIIGAELATALTGGKGYFAADSAVGALRVIPIGRIYRRNGAADETQIKELGKQLGVPFVCVAEISELMRSYYLDTRIVSVETAKISAVVTKHGNWMNAAEVLRIARDVAARLVGGRDGGVGKAKVEIDRLGAVYETIMNPDKAIADYTNAIRKGPNVEENYFYRGYAYSVKDDYCPAIADFTEVIRLNPNYAEAYNHRGVAYSETFDDDLAIADFTEAIRLNPNYAEAYYNRGGAIGSGNEKSAVADYTEAIRLNPNYAAAYRDRAHLFYSMGAEHIDGGYNDLAIADYTVAIRLDPKGWYMYESRGEAYYDKKDYDRAIADYSDAIRLAPLDFASSYWWKRGNAYNDKGDYNSAIADYTEAIRRAAESALSKGMYYGGRGDAFSKKGDYCSAIADYSEQIQLLPENSNAYFNRGLAFDGSGDHDRANADYNRARLIDPSLK